MKPLEFIPIVEELENYRVGDYIMPTSNGFCNINIETGHTANVTACLDDPDNERGTAYKIVVAPFYKKIREEHVLEYFEDGDYYEFVDRVVIKKMVRVMSMKTGKFYDIDIEWSRKCNSVQECHDHQAFERLSSAVFNALLEEDGYYL